MSEGGAGWFQAVPLLRGSSVSTAIMEEPAPSSHTAHALSLGTCLCFTTPTFYCQKWGGELPLPSTSADTAPTAVQQTSTAPKTLHAKGQQRVPDSVTMTASFLGQTLGHHPTPFLYTRWG